MPLAYTGAGLALLVLFWQGLEKMENNPTNKAYWIPACIFLALPLLLGVYRRLRNHHHPRLKA